MAMKVTTTTLNGKRKTYQYSTIGGVPLNEYMRQKKRERCPPRKRTKKYQTLPKDLKTGIFILHNAGVGVETIVKLISSDSLRFGDYDRQHITVDCVRKFLKDPDEKVAITEQNSCCVQD